jgi:PadR family transcriptional regulator AphA
MQPSDGPALSLSEWLVLCLVCEEPTYGNALAGLLGRGGGLGQVWRVPRSEIYRSVERLEKLRLVLTVGTQPATKGPARVLVDATSAGRAAAVDWLDTPVEHARDVRSELLVKLALLDRAGSDPQNLLTAQRAQLIPIAAALYSHLEAASGCKRTLLLWRVETISATLRFLDVVLTSANPGGSSA